MFLITLVAFPIISYYLFNMCKNDYKESNWVVKLIWLSWVFILVLVIISEIFSRKESYLVLIMFSYFIVFTYYYIQHIKLQLQNINDIKYEKIEISLVLIKIFFMILIFTFYINLLEDRDVTRTLDILRYNSSWLLNLLATFLSMAVLFWLLYEIINISTNNVLKRIIYIRDLKITLKTELKKEIISELKKS